MVGLAIKYLFVGNLEHIILFMVSFTIFILLMVNSTISSLTMVSFAKINFAQVKVTTCLTYVM